MKLIYFIIAALFAFPAFAVSQSGNVTSGHCVSWAGNQQIQDAGSSCSSGSGTVTTTGSPASGNLSKFSGSTSITNGDLSGDCVTSGTLATTCTKTNGSAFVTSATTDTTNASNISSGTLGTARLPSPFTSGTASGSTSKFATASGTLTSGHCVQFDASGNVVDAGSACGSGSGGDTITSPNSTLTIGGTSSNTTLDVNVGNANTWSALQTYGNHISFGGATLNVTSLATSNLLQYNGTNWINITPASLGFISGNQTITLSGDTTGSGTTAITTTTTQLHGNTITNGDWCTSNGTIINCATSPPVTAFTGDGVIISNSASTGSVTDTLVSQAKNTVLAGPSSGSNATPTMRALVGADLPAPSASTLGGVESLAAVSHNFLTSISTAGVPAQAQPAFSDISGNATNAQLASQTANTLLGALTATTPSGIAVPSCADSSGNHLNWTSGTGFSCGTTDSHGGTVTSVTFTGDGVIDSSTPSSAVTTTGTVTATVINQSANTLLAGPASGSSAAPTFRAMVNADEPKLTQAVKMASGDTFLGGL